MIKLAESSGTIVYENGNQLTICRKPAPWLGTFMFLSGLFAFILLTNGLFQLFVFNKEAGTISTAAIILSFAGFFFGFILWRLMIYKKKINSIPLHELTPICILDFNSKNLLATDHTVLAPIDKIQLGRKMQMGSSSPKLVLTWFKNSLSIVNGNPFTGGITAVEQLLISKGIKRK